MDLLKNLENATVHYFPKIGDWQKGQMVLVVEEITVYIDFHIKANQLIIDKISTPDESSETWSRVLAQGINQHYHEALQAYLLEKLN